MHRTLELLLDQGLTRWRSEHRNETSFHHSLWFREQMMLGSDYLSLDVRCSEPLPQPESLGVTSHHSHERLGKTVCRLVGRPRGDSVRSCSLQCHTGIAS